jgi:hypothetical protein
VATLILVKNLQGAPLLVFPLFMLWSQSKHRIACLVASGTFASGKSHPKDQQFIGVYLLE